MAQAITSAQIVNGYEFRLQYGFQGILHIIHPDRTKAKTRFEGTRVLYEKTKPVGDPEPYLVEVPCSAIYVCPFSRSCIRAEYVMNRNNPEHRMLCENILHQNFKSGFRGLDHTGGFHLICDQKMSLMSYVYTPSSGHRYLVASSDDSKEYGLYESKGQLVREIFNTISSYGSVSGLEFCDLNKIPDDVIANLGAVKVPDVLNPENHLWLACIDKIINPEGLTGTWTREVQTKLHAQAGTLVDSFREYLEN